MITGLYFTQFHLDRQHTFLNLPLNLTAAMTGTRGKKPEEPETGSSDNEKEERPQQASKKDIKRTQHMVHELEEKIQGLNGVICNLTDKLGSVDSKFSQHDLRLAYLEAKTRGLQGENNRLRDRVDMLENEKRSMNLKIDGIKEGAGVNLSDTVLKLAAAVGVRCQPPDIDFVYRIGKARDEGRPRPLLVHFRSRAVRDNIYYGRSKLRRDDEWKSVYVNDDVNESTRRKRENLRAVALLCQVKNITHKLHPDSIVINGRKYTEHQIDLLPQGLRIEDAKTLSTGKGILFQSEHSFLSSFHEAPFVFEDRVHNTVEHGYNYTRAVKGKREDIAALIHTATTPQEAKRLGKLVPETAEFKKGKKQLVEVLTFEKFAQNPELQVKLVKTGDAKLLEATTDEYFGIGKHLNAKLIQDLTWTGSNHLGDILENLRKGFIGE